MTENTDMDIQSLNNQIRDLDQRLDSLADQLCGSGGCGQAKMLNEMIEKARLGLATRRLAIKETENATATQSQKDDAMQAHAAMVLSFDTQADWLESAVASWRQQRERQGPDWRIELTKLREQCTKAEQKCDQIAAAVRPRGLRDGNGTAIANYAAQALEECFKLRIRMLEFAESQAVNSVQEVDRFLRTFAGDIRQQQDHVNGFLANRLSEWQRETQS